jgi:hypothetical protein
MTINETHKNYLSKPEIQFWIPIIIYAVTLTSSFMLLSNKIDLLTQKVEAFNKEVGTLDSRVLRLADSVNTYIGTLRAHTGQ